MVERKSGPVKPPVIEGKARKAETKPPAPDTGGAETKPDNAADNGTTDTPPKALAAPATPPAAGPEPVSGAKPADPSASPAAGESVEPPAAATANDPLGARAEAVTGPMPKEAVPGKAAAPENKDLPSKPQDKLEDKPQGKPQDKPAAAKPAEAQRPVPPQPPASARYPSGPLLASAVISAIVGAIVGAGLAYGLAGTGLWPAPPGDDGPIADLQAEVSSLGADITATRSELAGLRQSASQPAPDPQIEASIAALRAELGTLTDRLDAVASGASSADAGAMAANVANLGERVGALSNTLDTVQQAGIASQSAMTELAGKLGDIETQLAARSDEPTPAETFGPALRLPLVLSGLEAAFSSGRPFGGDLGALREILPDTQVPAALSQAAPNGLVPRSVLATRFEAALPAMLAARPTDPNASWQDQTLDWFRTILALRPSGEASGDGPDAVIGRLEQAMERADMRTADTLFASLPEPMRQAAGSLPEDVAAQAQAEAFIASLRQSALETQGTPS